jgi:type IV pilus assembly protein PilQ
MHQDSFHKLLIFSDYRLDGITHNRYSIAAHFCAAIGILCVLSSGCMTIKPSPTPDLQGLIDEALARSDQSHDMAVVTADSRIGESLLNVDESGNPYKDASAPVGLGERRGNGRSLESTTPLPLVSEEFVETDVREALLILSEDANIDLVMDEKVSGIVNSRIDEMPVDEAIEKILLPLGFFSARDENRIVVAPADPDSPLFSYVSESIEYRPQHVEVATLMAAVPSGLKGFAKPIEGTKLIMIEAPTHYADLIIDRFVSVDQPVPQVVLEAIICVVSPESGFQLGLDWQHAVELNGATAFKLGSDGLALTGAVSPNGLNSVFSDFSTTSAFIKLLNEKGYLTIRASPHVMAKDGEKANISINRETFFSPQGIQAGNNASNGSFFVQQNIQKVLSGISLDITPEIRGDVVTINIEKAEVSEDIRTVNSDLALNPFPIINRRSVSTTVHVKDGKTIVIGGLVQNETVERQNSVPGFSRIPGLGYLFRSKQRQTREADVVIFISPRIVKPTCFE